MGSKTQTSINTRRKHVFIRNKHDKNGINKYDRHGIADVFTEFYEKRQTSMTKTHGHEDSWNRRQLTMTSKRGRDNTVAVQGMNIEILTVERRIRYFG